LFLVDILPLDPDPYIFADPDPGSQNLADPTDPDPKHWLNGSDFHEVKILNYSIG